jgi:hypothetical protein
MTQKNLNKGDNHQSSLLQKQVSQEWNKVYTKFLKDVNSLIKKAGGSKNVHFEIMCKKKMEKIDLDKVILCLSDF